MNRKLFSKFLSSFSLTDYGIWTYVVCFAVLAISAIVKYVEIQTFWDAVILVVWPVYGLWLFLRYFAWEMVANDTLIPAWVGYLCFLFFIGWISAVFGYKRKKIRKIIVLLLILFSLTFIVGCTYMTAALSPYGLI